MTKKKYKSTQKLSYQKIDDVVNFGIHNGQTIEHIYINDSSYFKWAKKNLSKFKLSKEIITKLNLDPDTYKVL